MSRALLKATTVVGGMTLISRVLGLVRDIVFARYFAPGPVMDAFLVAFKIPNFMRRLFGEGAFSQAFVPVLSEHKTRDTAEEVRALNDRVAGTFGVLLFGVTAAGVIVAPVLVYVFAPGFQADADKYALTVDMLRVTFPYLMFISLTAFASGILNTYGRFAVPAFTPALLNIVMIATTVWIAPHFEERGMALAWGVFFGGVLQLAFQLPFLARLGLLPRPRWGWSSPPVRRVFRLMLPALFGSSVQQISLLLDTLIASFLITGSVSWLYYADRLMEFPLGVFGIALATVVLPSLSQRHAEQSPERFSQTLDWALRFTFLIGMPASVGLFVLAGPMAATLFQYGEFTARDTHMTAAALMPYAIGMFGFTLVKILAPGYYARQDTRTPVRIGLIALAVNVAFNLLVVVPWHLAGLPYAHAGLALSTSLAAFVNAALLYRGLRRQDAFHPEAGWGIFLARVFLANAAMGALLWWGAGATGEWSASGAFERVLRLAGWIGAGAVVYAVALWLAGLRPRHLRGHSGAAPV
ncbi:MAG TPA: murein biosynthesis integral membrane protein MurJ [Gammaproteobacteria bacterium]|nr:murein biosynthesis integral membrane protein MurJ [Gammaproteobacteria bacterium]